MDFAKHIETEQGEIVKSNYEKDVANYLYEQGIEYVYEKPLKLSDGVTVHPDFYLPEFDIYIEIYGMWGDQKYSQDRSKKQWAYDQDDIKVIELWFGNGRGSFRYHLEREFEVLTGVPFPSKQNRMSVKKGSGRSFRSNSKESLFDQLDKLFAKFPHLASRLLFLVILLLLIVKFFPQSEQGASLHTIAPKLGVTAQESTKQPALPTLPEPKKVLVEIAKFTNEKEGSYLSSPFSISTAPFKIEYKCDCMENPSFCSAILADPSSGTLRGAITSRKQPTGSVEYNESGSFWIAGNIYGKCTFTVYEYK